MDLQEATLRALNEEAMNNTTGWSEDIIEDVKEYGFYSDGIAIYGEREAVKDNIWDCIAEDDVKDADVIKTVNEIKMVLNLIKSDYVEVEFPHFVLNNSAEEEVKIYSTDSEGNNKKLFTTIPDITLNESKKIKTEAYTAREQFNAVMKKYSDNDKKEIKVVAETEHYILTVARNRENSEGIYLSVTTGKDELDMLPDVYVRQDYKGKCEKVDINWSAMGNCSVAETEAFINALKEAIEFAKQIEGKDFSNEI